MFNNVPNTTTYVYTPLSIVSNSGATTAKVNLTTFDDVPTGFYAPNVKWTIESNATDATIVFTWQSSIEPSQFTARRNFAKVYRFDGVDWIEVASGVSTTADGFSITANVTTLGIFAVMVVPRTGPITSVQTGFWNDASTWDNGVPTETDDVIIDANNTVTVNFGSSPAAYCNNLTINANATLNQTRRLIIGGDVTINGTFNHNPFNDFQGTSTEIGAIRIGGSQFTGTNSTDPAGKHLVTVSGTLRIGGGTLDAGLALAGRIVFNTGSTFDMNASNSYLTLTGWSDPNDATPQYLMDIDNLGTANLYNSQSQIIVTHSNGTQPILSNGRNFIESTCNFYTPINTTAGFSLLDNTTTYFGGATQRLMNMITMGSNTTLNLTNTTLRLLSARNGGSIYSSGGQFSSLTAGNGTTLYGDYTLIDNCNVNFPVLFSNIGNLSFDNMMTLNVNVTKEAILNIPNGVTQNLLGTFNLQNGKVVVQGGTLDLHNARAVNGLGPTRYFETKRDNGSYSVGSVTYTALGAVLLPVMVSNTTPVTFNLGVTIPNGSNPPISVYAPISVTSNTNSNVSVSLQPLVVPSGYVAPTIQWDITPSGSPTLSIIFKWTAASESNAFSLNRASAKVYHYNSNTAMWEQLNSGPVTGPDADGLYSITVSGVTEFSPFAVMIPNAVLKAELIDFTAKSNNATAELTWQTATETKVKNFEIEKSTDGQKFEKIAEVKANNTPSVYQAFDDQFLTSAYYRLKINDLDGKVSYSKTINLEKASASKSLKVYPNPAFDFITIDNANGQPIDIINALGQVVRSFKKVQTLDRVDIASLPKGVYFVKSANVLVRFVKGGE